MTSFAFNTLIGQVTNIAVNDIGWRFFVVFAVCNATNALFFWLVLPETKRVPLEQMSTVVFAPDAPWVVVGKRSEAYRAAAAAASVDAKDMELKKDVV